MAHRPLGLLYLVFAVLQLVIVAVAGPIALPLLWISATFGLAGAAYLLGQPLWMGKQPDGTVTPVMSFLMLPYLAVALTAAFIRRRPGEPAWNEVAPGLFVGRRVQAVELPPDTAAVIDLTSEFAEPRDVREGRVYRCLPTLDGCASDPQAYRALVSEVAGWTHRTYIHCAVGHGRSAAVAAGVLVLRGQARDAAEAEALMRKTRPGIHLNAAQRSLVDGLR